MSRFGFGTQSTRFAHGAGSAINLELNFPSDYERNIEGFGDTFYLDEVFVKIDDVQHYLWRAVDQDGEVVDVFLQKWRDGAAAKQFFKRFLKQNRQRPRKIVTDKLRSYGVAHTELMADVIHDTSPLIHPICG